MIASLQERARAGWLAVVVTGLVLLGAVPFYAEALPRGSADYTESGSAAFLVIGGSGRLGRLAGGAPSSLGRYWLVVVPVAYLLLAGWFAVRARRSGLQQRWTVYVLSGLLLFLALLATVLPVTDPLPILIRQVSTPVMLLAGSLILLGRVERDRRLVALGSCGVAAATYVGLALHGGFVVPDGAPLEPLLSALLSPQGVISVLGLAFVVLGLGWRPRRS